MFLFTPLFVKFTWHYILFLSWIKSITNEVFLNPTVNMLAYETLESVFDPFSILLPASSCTLNVGGEK